MNRELPDVQAGFRKGRGTRDQIADICWIIKKAREFRKISTFALLTTPKRLTATDPQKHGGEELRLAEGQGRRPRAPGCDGTGAAETSYPMSKECRLHGRRRAEGSYSMFKVRRGSLEEIPLVQGKGQRLRFAGAAVK